MKPNQPKPTGAQWPWRAPARRNRPPVRMHKSFGCPIAPAFPWDGVVPKIRNQLSCQPRSARSRRVWAVRPLGAVIAAPPDRYFRRPIGTTVLDPGPAGWNSTSPCRERHSTASIRRAIDNLNGMPPSGRGRWWRNARRTPPLQWYRRGMTPHRQQPEGRQPPLQPVRRISSAQRQDSSADRQAVRGREPYAAQVAPSLAVAADLYCLAMIRGA